MPPQLFRSARELLLNVVKHARASSVRLEVAREEGTMRITVADDGAGFDPTDLRISDEMSRFGLFSVRERMAALGGMLELDSAPGRGTRVSLEVPLDETDDGGETP